jgi:hypothetical protein
VTDNPACRAQSEKPCKSSLDSSKGRAEERLGTCPGHEAVHFLIIGAGHPTIGFEESNTLSYGSNYFFFAYSFAGRAVLLCIQRVISATGCAERFVRAAFDDSTCLDH